LLSTGSLARRKPAWNVADSRVSPLSIDSRRRSARNRDTPPRPPNRHDDTSPSLATLSVTSAFLAVNRATDSLDVASMSYSYGEVVTLDEG